MAKRLYLCRITHEFVVAADDADDASDIADEARMEEIDMMEATVVREITSVGELGSLRDGCPYGDDRTCAEILESDDDEA